MPPWAGPRASKTTCSSLPLTIYHWYYYLLLLFVVAAAAAPSMLLIAPLMIALLLLLPDDTTPVSVKQGEHKGRLGGGAYRSQVATWVLPQAS